MWGQPAAYRVRRLLREQKYLRAPLPTRTKSAMERTSRFVRARRCRKAAVWIPRHAVRFSRLSVVTSRRNFIARLSTPSHPCIHTCACVCILDSMYSKPESCSVACRLRLAGETLANKRAAQSVCRIKLPQWDCGSLILHRRTRCFLHHPSQ
jgi:hypothetical protein